MRGRAEQVVLIMLDLLYLHRGGLCQYVVSRTTGVNTSEVLTAYIAAIQALRSLDPSGVLLELICEPVRRYLRLFIFMYVCVGCGVFMCPFLF